jgi:hypothetical protein
LQKYVGWMLTVMNPMQTPASLASAIFDLTLELTFS